MTTTTSGLLLLLIGVAGLAGFLTGNLDRWLGYLFDPTRPGLGAGAGGSSAPTMGNLTGNLRTTAGERRG